MSSLFANPNEGALDRTLRAIQELPAGIRNSLLFVCGVLTSHPRDDARDAALEQLQRAAVEMAAGLRSGDGDGLCSICDAEKSDGEDQ